ncbi:MAG: HEAT repeat domain-containing protein [Planctomycetaceae bacterium]|nr:HEAT repeat domain-containing protein [Planctomycetaceae bacterium]
MSDPAPQTQGTQGVQIAEPESKERLRLLRIQKNDGKIRALCDGCGQRVKTPLEKSGQQIQCPKCQGVVEMPALDVFDQFAGQSADNVQMLISGPVADAQGHNNDDTSFELSLTKSLDLIDMVRSAPDADGDTQRRLSDSKHVTPTSRPLASAITPTSTTTPGAAAQPPGEALPKAPSVAADTTARPTATVRTTCPTCSLEITAPAQFAGVTVPCEACGAKVRFPERTLVSARSSADEDLSWSSGIAERREVDLLRSLDRALNLEGTVPERIRPVDVEELSGWTTRRYLKQIKAAIKSDTSDKLATARTALRTLARHGEIDARDDLFKLYETAQGELKRDLLHCLAELRHPAVFVPLMRSLGSATESEVLPIARALCAFGDPRVVLPLLFAADVHERHKPAIHAALVEMQGVAGNELCRIVTHSEDQPLLRTIAELLGRFSGGCPVKAFSKLLKSDHDEVRENAAASMAKLADGNAVKMLSNRMKDRNEKVRALLARAFGRCDTEEAISRLMKCVEDPSPLVRREVLHTLGASGKTVALPAVRRRIDDPDNLCRIAAAEALGRLGDPQGLTLLLNQLREQPLSSEEGLAVPIAQAIGRMQDPRGTVPLLNLLTTSDVNLKVQIAAALGAMQQRVARESLERLLTHDPSERVRAAAAQALGCLGDSEARPAIERALRDATNVRVQAIAALVKLKGRAAESVETLAPMLHVDHKPAVRRQALQSLTELGSEHAIPVILPLLADADEDLREQALVTLRQLGEKRAEEALLKAAGKPPVAGRGTTAEMPQVRGGKSAKAAPVSRSGPTWTERLHGLSGLAASLSPASLVGVVTQPVVIGAIALLLCVGVGIYFGMNPGSLRSGQPVIRGSVASVSVSNDGKLIAAGRTRGMLEIWDVEQQQVIASSMSLPSKFVCFGPGAKNLLCAHGKRLALVPFEDGKLGEPLPVEGHTGNVLDMKFTPDHKYAVTLGEEGIIIRWDMEQSRPASTIQVDAKLSCIAISADGHELVGSTVSGELFLWDMDSQEQIATISAKVRGIRSLAIQADGPLIAAGGEDGSVVLWDPERPTDLQVDKSSPVMVRAVSFPPGGRLYVARGAKVELLDINSGDQIAMETSLETISTLAVDQSGQLVSVGNEDESPVLVFDSGSGKLMHQLDQDL